MAEFVECLQCCFTSSSGAGQPKCSKGAVIFAVLCCSFVAGSATLGVGLWILRDITVTKANQVDAECCIGLVLEESCPSCGDCTGNVQKLMNITTKGGQCGTTEFSWKPTDCKGEQRQFEALRCYKCWEDPDCSAVSFDEPHDSRTKTAKILLVVGGLLLLPIVCLCLVMLLLNCIDTARQNEALRALEASELGSACASPLSMSQSSFASEHDARLAIQSSNSTSPVSPRNHRQHSRPNSPHLMR
ncbi:hypothetical protein DIPPA_17067 [Diplonema papillatum]|nr:hypothetical protein DIPPA_17067 [Diplonema papillatum]